MRSRTAEKKRTMVSFLSESVNHSPDLVGNYNTAGIGSPASPITGLMEPTRAYAVTDANNYGVNRDNSGHLSSFAWGANVGWINFAPTNGGVTIDPRTGAFAGYAWGENIGWISLKGDSGPTAYGVVTNFRQIYLPLVLKPS